MSRKRITRARLVRKLLMFARCASVDTPWKVRVSYDIYYDMETAAIWSVERGRIRKLEWRVDEGRR